MGTKIGSGRVFLEALTGGQPCSDCVTWPYGKAKGYAVVKDWRGSGRTRKAYQVAWELLHDAPWPEGLVARHLCGAGSRGCVNPWHIQPGTALENRHDTLAMGTNVTSPGERNGMSKLTRDQVREIRRLALDGHLTQGEIASRFGIRQSSVSRIKGGVRWAQSI